MSTLHFAMHLLARFCVAATLIVGMLAAGPSAAHAAGPSAGGSTEPGLGYVGIAATPGGTGYWLAQDDGTVTAHGDAKFFGDMSAKPLNQPIVGIAATPDGGGYWLVAADGGVFTFGDATFHGSTGNLTLNQPIVSLAPTRDGKGYWLVASDGGVFTFGDATFHGSTGNLTLNKPVVGITSSPTSAGYRLVAADGGVFSFGDAPFYGSAGNLALDLPIEGMALTPDAKGYWMVAEDGGIFSFGDAPFLGSLGGLDDGPVVGMVPTGGGYDIVEANGTVTAFRPASGTAPTGPGALATLPATAAVAAPACGADLDQVNVFTNRSSTDWATFVAEPAGSPSAAATLQALLADTADLGTALFNLDGCLNSSGHPGCSSQIESEDFGALDVSLDANDISSLKADWATLVTESKASAACL